MLRCLYRYIRTAHTIFQMYKGREALHQIRYDFRLGIVQPAGPLGHYSLSNLSSHISSLCVCSDCRSVVTEFRSGSEGGGVPSTSIRRGLQRLFLGPRILGSTPSRWVSYQVLLR